MVKAHAKPRLPMMAVDSLELAKYTMAGKNLSIINGNGACQYYLT